MKFLADPKGFPYKRKTGPVGGEHLEKQEVVGDKSRKNLWLNLFGWDLIDVSCQISINIDDKARFVFIIKYTEINKHSRIICSFIFYTV